MLHTSLLFFFDMPPVPEVDALHPGLSLDPDAPIVVEFKNYCGHAAELYWVGGQSMDAILVEANWLHGAKVNQNTFTGHKFEARDLSGTILQQFIVTREESVYVLEDKHLSDGNDNDEL